MNTILAALFGLFCVFNRDMNLNSDFDRTLSVDYLQESAKLKRELKEAAKEAARNVPFSWIFGR